MFQTKIENGFQQFVRKIKSEMISSYKEGLKYIKMWVKNLEQFKELELMDQSSELQWEEFESILMIQNFWTNF